jgi:hypothetical protein
MTGKEIDQLQPAEYITLDYNIYGIHCQKW